MTRFIVLMISVMVVFTACSRSKIVTENSNGPDPLDIVMQKPLEQPDDYQTLPAPGGNNRADLSPATDVVQVLR